MSQVDFRGELLATETELYRRNFAEFVKAAWPQIDPAPLDWNWHLDAICDHLQAIIEGKMSKLIINMPPGLAKSMLVTVLFSTWYWTVYPQLKGLFASYDKNLATEHSDKARTLIRSDWYQERFCQNWNIREDADGKTFFKNTRHGARQIVSPDSGATGFRGDIIVYDDPLKAGDAHNANEREKVIKWKTGTMASRFNDMRNAREIIVMQRLHEGDLTGYLLKAGGYQHLNLPMEFEPEKRSKTFTLDGTPFWQDPRTKPGELLFPSRFPAEVVERLKGPQGLGSYEYAGQYQQRPTPAGGGVFKRAWFKNRFTDLPPFDDMGIFVDAGFRKTDDSDFVAVQVWGRYKNRAYFVDTDWRRMGFHETLDSIRSMKRRWPFASGIWIEAAASGDAIIETLKMELPGVNALSKQAGKIPRIHASTKYYEAGDVWFPADAPWVDRFIEEALAFDRGDHDDAIDCASHALAKLLLSSGLAWLERISRF